MVSFSYKAVDQMGRAAHGYIDANNALDLETRLTRIGLELISCRQHRQKAATYSNRKVSHQDLAMFCYQLEQLHSAGVPLLEALHDLCDSSQHASLRKTLAAVCAEVEGGKTLSQAMAMHPLVFNQVFVNLVAAGEYSGKLSTVFSHLCDTLRWQHDIVSQTKRLTAYPLFLALVMLFTIVFLMTYLVPQMVTFLSGLGHTLPLNTRILIASSNLFIHYWWLMLGFAIVVFSVSVWVVQSIPAVRERYDAFKLNMPVLGRIIKKIILARFAHYFALMYQAGIPILQALKISENIVANRCVARDLQRVQLQINAGSSVYESFGNLSFFPQSVLRMIKVGENTGNLDQTLLNISQFYDSEVRAEIAHMLAMLEPLLTVVLGGILAFIMLSVLGPIYDSFASVGI